MIRFSLTNFSTLLNKDDINPITIGATATIALSCFRKILQELQKENVEYGSFANTAALIFTLIDIAENIQKYREINAYETQSLKYIRKKITYTFESIFHAYHLNYGIYPVLKRWLPEAIKHIDNILQLQ